MGVGVVAKSADYHRYRRGSIPRTPKDLYLSSHNSLCLVQLHLMRNTVPMRLRERNKKSKPCDAEALEQ